MSEKKCIKKACSIEIGKFLVFGILLLLLLVSVASAADTGFVAPTSNVGGSGVTSPQNAYVDDTSYASFNGGGSSNWNYYGYDFSSIPSGATIDGIEVNALGSRNSNSANSRYMRVRLSWDSGATWTSYSTDTTEWTTSITNHILGGTVDKWGHSWTRTEIVNSFRIQAQWRSSSTGSDANLDYLPVRVYYTSGAGTTYSVSGHVTNASNSAAISGATVSADSTPPQSNTTNGTGYYNLLLSNGSYTITASQTGYNSNSIPITVIGAPVGNANIALTPVPPSGGAKIIVATNRYVILDDPISPGNGAQTTAGFTQPGFSGWSTNQWSGAQTQITGYALLLDENGKPVTNSNVIFTLKNWNNLNSATSPNIVTNSKGIANYTFDMNARNYYGNWNVSATALGKTESTGFIYNWFGCQAGGCESHGSRDVGTPTPSRQNSPYTLGREAIISDDSHHRTTDSDCVGCHRSYGGTGGGSSFSGQPTKTADVHVTDTCASCHIGITSHAGGEPIKSCTNCHSWANLSQENTMSSGTTPMSNYSGNAAAAGHNPANAIPCIICHGPMHNITKPDESLRLIKNNIVEDSHCLTCHTSFEKHNGGLGCTLCHSQDAHAIKVLSQTAGYVNKGDSYQGDCTNCHQNATFLNSLKIAPKAGSYSGTAPQVQKPLNHSTDSAGTKWDTYWTSTKDACIYCHGDNKHIATRLGNAAVPVGNDPIGGPIGSGTVCSSCHNPTDSNYAATMALFARDPVGILLNQANWNNSGTDHASYGTTDEACKSCHNGALSSQSASISEFVHNVDVGKGGGPNCVNCHDIGASQAKVDVSKMNTATSIHNTLNSGATASGADNKRCYACHTNSTVSADGVVNEAELPTNAHPDSYKIPKNCTQCHTDSGNFGALIASEHNSAGSELKTKQYATVNDSCVNCHNKTEMIISNSDPGGVKSIFASVSHYGSNKTLDSLYNTGSTSNCTYCHQNPSGTFTTEMVNASWNASIDKHTELGTNPGCTNCHSSGRIHESVLTKPALTLPNSSYCQTCHTSLSKQKHNGSVDCTDCHLASKQNIHPVQYLQPDGSFKTNSPENKTSAVNCTDCHQGTGLLNAPLVPDKLNHSTDRNGTKWGTYWTSTMDACIYCHGDIKHNATRLGNASVPVGSDQIGGAIGLGTVCSSCHNPADSNYLATMALLSPEPVGIISAGLNWNASGTDHASYGTTDSACQSCHGGVLSASPDISEFAHNVDVGKAGGPDCLSCHNSTGSANHRVDGNAITTGMHADLNAKDPADPNSKCWGCHDTDGNISNNPSNQLMGDRYNSPYKCVDCHLSTGEKSSAYGAFIVSEHYPSGNNISVLPGDNLAACIQCHNKSQMKVSYENPDNLFTNYSIVSHYGKNRTDMHNSNETNCSYCHQNPSEFNDIFVNPLNTQITHNNGNSCYICHRESGQTDGRIHDSPLIGGAGGACLQCHSTGGGAPVVDETDLGDHKNLSGIGGTGVLTNEDCSTCHYNNPHTGTNPTNTYYCIDCHNKTQQLGNSSIRSTKKFDDKKHGKVTCINCHIADGAYHQGNPRGSVANSTYVSRNASSRIYTDCGDCHLAANLDDAPFYAPGGGSHVRDCGNSGGCHSGNTIVAAVHSTTPFDNSNKKPQISDPKLNSSTVIQGTDVNISVTVNVTLISSQALVDGAQYQINNSDNTQIIQSWTPMIASDGNFNSISEGAFARINTTNLLAGTYNIFARGMGGGWAQNTLERYYPMNGDVSPVKSVPLTVQLQGGFITGTITSGGSVLEGALVTTTGASDITGPDGTYSLSVPPGTYTVTASMEPTHYPNSVSNIEVRTQETSSGNNMVLNLRPTGDISGNVTTV